MLCQYKLCFSSTFCMYWMSLIYKLLSQELVNIDCLEVQIVLSQKMCARDAKESSQNHADTENSELMIKQMNSFAEWFLHWKCENRKCLWWENCTWFSAVSFTFLYSLCLHLLFFYYFFSFLCLAFEHMW